MTRIYTFVGKAIAGGIPRLDTAINDVGRCWQPFSPSAPLLSRDARSAQAITDAIRRLHLRNVTHVAVSRVMIPYNFYGIRTNEERSFQHLYFIDRGDITVPAAMETLTASEINQSDTNDMVIIDGASLDDNASTP